MAPGFAIGIDIGGTNLRIASVDTKGTLLEKVTSGVKVLGGRDAVIDAMCEGIKAQAARFCPAYKLAGVGIGLPGIIDKRTGMIRESPNLPGWHEFPVRDEIARRVGFPVILENDANAAALGENWLGAAAGFDDVLMITLGTGVGGGIVLRQRVWHGMTGMAGEVGHMTVDPHGPQCGCGNTGCVEQYASATAVVRKAREMIAAGTAAGLKRLLEQKDAEFSSKMIYNLAIQGDEQAREIFRLVGWALGILMADLVNAFNLHMYVVGGGVSSAWDAFAPSMFHELRRRSMVYAATAPSTEDATGASAKIHTPDLPPAKKTIITRALLGSDAGLYGAARLPMLALERSDVGLQAVG